MSTIAPPARPRLSLERALLDKVPGATVAFWAIALLCPAVGTAATHYVQRSLGFGQADTTYVAGALLSVVLLIQSRSPGYVPAAYWAVFLVIGAFGTLVAERVPVAAAAAGLVTVLSAWHVVERGLAFDQIDSPPREAFYWLAVLAAVVLGAATGDHRALAIVVLGAATALLAAVGRVVVAFWLGLVTTYPLGAAIGAALTSQLGRATTSYVLLAAIVALVALTQTSLAGPPGQGETGPGGHHHGRRGHPPD